jgi:hypothetical protein
VGLIVFRPAFVTSRWILSGFYNFKLTPARIFKEVLWLFDHLRMSYGCSKALRHHSKYRPTHSHLSLMVCTGGHSTIIYCRVSFLSYGVFPILWFWYAKATFHGQYALSACSHSNLFVQYFERNLNIWFTDRSSLLIFKYITILLTPVVSEINEDQNSDQPDGNIAGGCVYNSGVQVRCFGQYILWRPELWQLASWQWWWRFLHSQGVRF